MNAVNTVVLPDSAIIDRFGRTPNFLLLMEERNSEIQNGTVVYLADGRYFVQEVLEGNRGRIGLKAVKQ